MKDSIKIAKPSTIDDSDIADESINSIYYKEQFQKYLNADKKKEIELRAKKKKKKGKKKKAS